MTQSSTRLMMGTLPTGMSALDATLVPSLKGYKLASARSGRQSLKDPPLAVPDQDDSDKVLRVDHSALCEACGVEHAMRGHLVRQRMKRSWSLPESFFLLVQLWARGVSTVSR